MKQTEVLFWCFVFIPFAISLDLPSDFKRDTEENAKQENTRGRRGVIEEEKFYNAHVESKQQNINQPWIPGPLPPEEDPTTKISIANEAKEVLPLYQTTERVTDKPTGRGARASNENWVKLPFPNHEIGQRDHILTPPQPSGELINSRMPRVNFVTQNKALEASESRNDKDLAQRPTTDEIRTEFIDTDEQDMHKYKPVYPRQAVYYPEESRRSYYDDRYNAPDDLYRRNPYYDMYDRRAYYPGYSPRIDRYDESYDNQVPRKPKRLIYYAHLPEVVRTPPSVDLRYRYSVDPYRRYEDDVYARNGRYDYRFRNRYPYSPLRKEDRNYRDLASAGTVNNDKKVDEKVTPTAILPQKDVKLKNNQEIRNSNRNTVNSHQYHENVDTYNNPTHKAFENNVRSDDSYLRYDERPFPSVVDQDYQRKY